MGPLVDLTPPTKSYGIAYLQKGVGKTNDANWCVKNALAKHTVGARPYCTSAFRHADRIQRSIKKVLRVTQPLTALAGIKDTMHYQHGRKELPTA